MAISLVPPELHNLSSIKRQIDSEIDSLVAALPDPKDLTPEQRRGIIARYSAVLEGNFIYWMTAAYLSVRSEEARPILIENLREKLPIVIPRCYGGLRLRRCHPAEADAMAVRDNFDQGPRIPGAPAGSANVLTMGFFESYIQRFMSYLADLAVAKALRNLNIPTCTVFATLLTQKAS